MNREILDHMLDTLDGGSPTYFERVVFEYNASDGAVVLDADVVRAYELAQDWLLADIEENGGYR